MCGLAALVLYALTTSPFALNEDVAEFQALSATHGIAHAGYPAFLLALETMHRLPISTPAYRANLVSGVSAAVAVAMAVLVCFAYTHSRLASVGAAIALGLSYSFWNDATRAEVYAFGLALSTSAFFACLRYEATSRTRALVVCAVLTGLALTAHLGSLALAAVVLATLVRQVRRGSAPRRHLGIALAGVAVGLLPLALIPLRDTPLTTMNYIALTFDEYTTRHVAWAPDLVTRLRRTVLLLSGSQFLEGWFHPFAATFERLRLLGWHLLFNDLYIVGTGLALLGLMRSAGTGGYRGRLLIGWAALVLVLVMLAAFPMVLTSFYLPGLWVLSVGLGIGLAQVAKARRAFGGVVLGLLVLTPLVRMRITEPPAFIDRPSIAAAWSVWPEAWDPFRPDPTWDEFGRGVLTLLPGGAHVVVCWEEGTTLRYLQLAERRRPDVTVHMACDSSPRIARILETASARGEEVFSTIQPTRLRDLGVWEIVGRWPRGMLAHHTGRGE
jgi:hypothetical protein